MPRELIFPEPGKISYMHYDDRMIGDDEVKIKTILSGISHGTEMNMYRGTAPGFHKHWDKSVRMFLSDGPRKTFPVSPGYECVGRVIQTGSSVEDVRVGDLVWVDRPHREINIASQQEARGGILPPGMTPEKGIFCALTRVALDAVHCAQIKLGDRVVVVGLGVIGLISIQLAKLNGAEEVFAIDHYPVRLQAAKSLGAIAVDSKAGDAAYKIKKWTESEGVDSAIEVSGDYGGLRAAISSCRIGGLVVTGSSYQGDGRGLYLGEEYHRNRITLVSSMSVNGCPHRAYPLWDFDRLNKTARHLLSHDTIQVEAMITQRISFDKATSGYSLIDQHPEQVIKVALVYED